MIVKLRPGRRVVPAFLLAFVLHGLSPEQAWSTDYTWTNSSDTVATEFNNPLNWNFPVNFTNIPGSGDRAFSSMGTIKADVGNGFYWEVGSFYLGADAGATMNIGSGELQLRDNFVIGLNGGGDGRLNITSNTASLRSKASTTYIGSLGDAQVSLSGGGHFVNDGELVVAASGGSAVTISISGSGSQFVSHADQYSYLGEAGKLNLNLSSGGVFATDANAGVILANQSGSEVALNVSGSGSEFYIQGHSVLGFHGKATATVSSGGQIYFGSGFQVGSSNADTRLHINGTAASRGTVLTKQLDVASGQVVFDGGILKTTFAANTNFFTGGNTTINSGGAFIDTSNTSSSSVTVSTNFNGGGVLSKIGGGTMVLTGFNTQSGLNIEGGTVSVASDGAIGYFLAGVDLYNGSTLAITQSISMNRTIEVVSGTGTISVDSGKTVTQAQNFITSNGGVLRDGAGTLIVTSDTNQLGMQVDGGKLQFGDGSNSGFVNGNVTLNNNATVSFNTSGLNFENENSITGNGVLQKEGSGALTHSGTLNVSSLSVLGGTFLVSSGGTKNATNVLVNNGALQVGSFTTLSSGAANVGNDAGTSGSATVTGTWSNSGDLNIGNNGHGSLTIQSGGLLANLTGSVGSGAGSNSTAGVSGTWNNTAFLSVGRFGTGALTINAGGLVKASSGTHVGEFSGSSGSIVINGTSGNRGILETQWVDKGSGAGTLTLAGGIIKATDSTNLIRDFSQVTLSGDGGFIDTNGNTSVILSPLTGSGGLTKLGNGTLYLTAANNFGGTLSITQGTVVIGDSGTSGSITANVVNSGALVFSRSDNHTYFGNITGSGNVRQTGTGVLTLTGTNSHSGGTYIFNGGVLSVASNLSLGRTQIGVSDPVFITGSTLRTTANMTIDRDITLTGIATLDVTAGTALDQIRFLEGDGTLVKEGGGMLRTYLNNTYTGETYVNDGALSIISGSINHGTAAMNVGTAAGKSGVLNILGGSVNSAAGYIGTVSGATGSVFVNHNWNTVSLAIGSSGTGSLTLGSTGTLNVGSGSGTVQLAQNATGVGTLYVGSGAFTGTVLSAAAVNGGAGNALVRFNHTNDLTFSPKLTGNLSVQKDGSGATTLTGAHTYTGATQIDAGTLVIGNNTNFNSAIEIASGAKLRLDITQDVNLKKSISGAGAIEVVGSGTTARLSGDNSGFTGTFTLGIGARGMMWSNVDAGSAAAAWDISGVFAMIEPGVGVGTSTTYLGSLSGINPDTIIGVFGESTGGVRTLEVGALNTDTLYAGRFVDDGSGGFFAKSFALRKVGTGTLTLTNNTSTHTGGTEINGGKILLLDATLGNGGVNVGANGGLAGNGLVKGAASISGDLLPGTSAGTMIFVTNLSLTSTADVHMELASIALMDRILVGNQLTYGGKLHIHFLGGYVGEIGVEYDLFDFGSYAGTFDEIVLDSDDLVANFDYGTGVLTFEAMPEPHAAMLMLLGIGCVLVRRRSSGQPRGGVM